MSQLRWAERRSWVFGRDRRRAQHGERTVIEAREPLLKEKLRDCLGACGCDLPENFSPVLGIVVSLYIRGPSYPLVGGLH